MEGSSPTAAIGSSRQGSSRSVKPGGNWKALKKTLDTSTSTTSPPKRRKSFDKRGPHEGRASGAPHGYQGVGGLVNGSGSSGISIKGKARALDGAADAGSGSGSASPLPWFAEDLSPEDLALVKGFSTSPGQDGGRTTWINSPGTVEEERRKKQIILGGHWGGDSQAKKEPGQFIAIDCEMVGVGEKGSESVLARVSIVNWHGHVLMDRFVKPMEKVTDYRTWVSGVRAKDLQGAPSFKEVQAEVAALVKGRVLVGHAIQNDLKALLLSHPRPLIRDTSTYQPLRTLAQTKFPGLRKLAKLVLGIEIQKAGEEHSSVEDARTTMAIFRTQKDGWEKSLKEGGKGKQRKSKAEVSAEWDDRVGAGQGTQPGLSSSAAKEGEKIEQTMKKRARGASSSSSSAAATSGRPANKKRQEAAPGWWKDDP